MFDDDASAAEHRAADAARAEAKPNAAKILPAAVPEHGRDLSIGVVGRDAVRRIVLDPRDERFDERDERAHTRPPRAWWTAACTLASKQRAESFQLNVRARAKPCIAKLGMARRVREQSVNGARDRLRVTRVDVHRGVAAGFDHHRGVRDDGRRSRRHCLERTEAEPFVERRKAEHRSRRVEHAKIGVAHAAEQADAIRDARGGGDAREILRGRVGGAGDEQLQTGAREMGERRERARRRSFAR